eukprot:scaffold4808_cov160-Skeletonema_dohrnii-CCMP3373.AAC.2
MALEMREEGVVSLVTVVLPLDFVAALDTKDSILEVASTFHHHFFITHQRHGNQVRCSLQPRLHSFSSQYLTAS